MLADPGQRLAQRQVGLHDGPDLPGQPAGHLGDDGGEEIALALEMGIDRGLGDPGGLGHRIHRGGLEALGDEYTPRRLENLLGLRARHGLELGQRVGHSHSN